MQNVRNPTSLRVLIIEDDLDVQANLQDILEIDRHQVELAPSVRDVKALEDLGEYSVVLLDRKLPDGDGDELLPLIREMAPETEVIFVTGHADLDGAVTALRHGAVDFLLKPIEPEMLRSCMNRIAKQQRMREELRDAQRRLIQSERLAAIGQTVAALSHEARNELHGMKLGLNLLPQVVDQREMVLEIVEELGNYQDHLQRLFEDVRGFAAPIHLETTSCHLPNIWRKAWSSLATQRKDRDVCFVEEGGDECPRIPGDTFRLEQVFRNLFENSLAACSDPVVIHVSCSPASPGQAISLTIQDNGPGLSEEQKRDVFDPFFTTKPTGTGLGMAIVNRIIEAHGGTIRVGAEAFQGAEFVITLPVEHSNCRAKEPLRHEAKSGSTVSSPSA